jgi:hypothetical protein
MNKKKRFLKTGGFIYTEVPLDELKIFLHVFRHVCHMCGRSLSFTNLGYIRVGREVELVLCAECLKDYAEYIESGEAGRRC